MNAFHALVILFIIFTILGIFGCLWCILWFTFVTDTPLSHPFISEKELKYIITNQKIELKTDVSDDFIIYNVFKVVI